MIKESERLVYKDNHAWLFCGDCRSMYELPDESIQMVVTSPPYWGLRKYSGQQDLIWGDNHCEHEWETTPPRRSRGINDVGSHPKQGQDAAAFDALPSHTCHLCGAWHGAYGLEPTVELYTQHTVEILREIRRVLRKDGVCFWNVGDSYASGKGTCFNPGGGKGSFSGHGDRKDAGAYPLDRGNISMLRRSGLKPKDLCLIPARVAIAAQEDGWWVRSDIIWYKSNPMPESVKDRPTESYEHILMLTKSARYYWDQEAVREAYTKPLNRWGGRIFKADTEKRVSYREMQKIGMTSAFQVGGDVRPNENGRNLRNIWSFPTVPYPDAHFAVFPERLPDLCIKAASKEGDVILDTFAGAGTSLKVAKNLNRHAIGYELSEEYCRLAVERIRQQVII